MFKLRTNQALQRLIWHNKKKCSVILQNLYTSKSEENLDAKAASPRGTLSTRYGLTISRGYFSLTVFYACVCEIRDTDDIDRKRRHAVPVMAVIPLNFANFTLVHAWKSLKATSHLTIREMRETGKIKKKQSLRQAMQVVLHGQTYLVSLIAHRHA